MKDSRIKDLIDVINNYYDCNLTDKRQTSSHTEARGVFLVIARRELGLKCSQLCDILNMSNSNVIRSHGLFVDDIKNNKHVKRRFEEVYNLVLKDVL